MSTCFKQNQVVQKDQQVKISNTKLVNNIVETPPTKNLDEEFKELHLERPVIDVLARAPYYNALLERYEKKLKLGEGTVERYIIDVGKFTQKMLERKYINN